MDKFNTDKIVIIRSDNSAYDFWSRCRNDKQITSDFKIKNTDSLHSSFIYNQRYTPFGMQNPPTFVNISHTSKN